ncbi:serine/threonine-protein kinase tnni3k-related [Anaeramoeba flamelloides]|uniref:Serine/threonine-protein kinase tnni3k-related n=1 Tax=Anaeramoeba flamelloides TaxID=1746091 RepID=A0ABQ8XG86_9EUKA|nr:serine/threonine-protein kinase tnni3k-related [Anaeramoeba flamelloides]
MFEKMTNHNRLESKKTQRLNWYTSHINCLTVFPNGTLVSGGGDYLIKVWDVISGICLKDLEGHSRCVSCLVALENGLLASGSHDETIKVWDLNNESDENKCLWSRYTGGWVNSLIYSAFKNSLVTGIMGGNVIRFWDLSTGARQKCELKGHTNSVRFLLELENGLLASGSDDKNIIIWNLTSCRPIHTLRGHNGGIRSLKVVGNNDLVSCSTDQTIMVWDMTTWRLKETLRYQYTGVNALCLIGGLLVSGCFKEIKILDFANDKSTTNHKKLLGHESNVTALIEWKSGKLVCFKEDHTFKIWDLNSDECLQTLGYNGISYKSLLQENQNLQEQEKELTKKLEEKENEFNNKLENEKKLNIKLQEKDEAIKVLEEKLQVVISKSEKCKQELQTTLGREKENGIIKEEKIERLEKKNKDAKCSLNRQLEIRKKLEHKNQTLEDQLQVSHRQIQNLQELVTSANKKVTSLENRIQAQLSRACKENKLDLAETTISLGADPNMKEESGNTSFHYVVMNKQTKMVELFLKHACETELPDNQKCTPLHIAIEHRYIAGVRLLLLHGANPNAVNEGGDNTLIAAIHKGELDIIKLLLANHNLKLETQNSDGQTALHVAIANGQDEIAKLLIDQDAVDIETQDGAGNTALLQSVLCGNINLSTYLLNAGAKIDVTNHEGNTIWHMAIQIKSKALITYIITNYSDRLQMGAVNKRNQTALDLARNLNDPGYLASIYVVYADCYIECEGGFKMDLQKAIEYIKKAIELQPDAAAGYHHKLGKIYLLTNQHEQAKEQFELVLAHNPDQKTECAAKQELIGINMRLGDIAKNKQDYTQYHEAISCYRAALKLSKELNKGIGNVTQQLIESYKLLADYYKYAKNYEQAQELYHKALHLDPKHKSVKSSLALTYTYQGSQSSRVGNWTQAVKQYTKALEYNPNLARAYHARANNNYLLTFVDKAGEDYLKAVDKAPSQFLYHYSLSCFYYAHGPYNRALNAAEKAITLNQVFAPAYYIKGLIHQKMGELKKAIKAFDNAIGCNHHLKSYRAKALLLHKLSVLTKDVKGKIKHLKTAQDHLKKTIYSSPQLTRRHLGTKKRLELIQNQVKIYMHMQSGGASSKSIELRKKIDEYKNLNNKSTVMLEINQIISVLNQMNPMDEKIFIVEILDRLITANVELPELVGPELRASIGHIANRYTRALFMLNQSFSKKDKLRSYRIRDDKKNNLLLDVQNASNYIDIKNIEDNQLNYELSILKQGINSLISSNGEESVISLCSNLLSSIMNREFTSFLQAVRNIYNQTQENSAVIEYLNICSYYYSQEPSFESLEIQEELQRVIQERENKSWLSTYAGIDALLGIVQYSPDLRRQKQAFKRIWRIDTQSEGFKGLCDYSAHEDWRIREKVYRCLLELLNHPDNGIRYYAYKAIQKMRGNQNDNKLYELFNSEKYKKEADYRYNMGIKQDPHHQIKSDLAQLAQMAENGQLKKLIAEIQPLVNHIQIAKNITMLGKLLSGQINNLQLSEPDKKRVIQSFSAVLASGITNIKVTHALFEQITKLIKNKDENKQYIVHGLIIHIYNVIEDKPQLDRSLFFLQHYLPLEQNEKSERDTLAKILKIILWLYQKEMVLIVESIWEAMRNELVPEELALDLSDIIEKIKKGQWNPRSDIIPTISFQELQYDKKVRLGKGSFGKVYKCTWYGKTYALKKLYCDDFTKSVQESFKKEIRIMWKLQNRNIVRLYGACLESGNYAMLLEYMSHGSLYKSLDKKLDIKLSLRQRYDIAMGIAKGVYYLHQNNILHKDLKSPNVLLNVHKDLKSPNVLLNDKLVPKITDFGMSEIRNETKTITNKKSDFTGGTVSWMAPELLDPNNENKIHTKATDVYSLGIIFWELVSEQRPYEQQLGNETSIAMKVIAGGRNPIPEPRRCPKEFARLIEKCWHQNAENRPTANQVVEELEQYGHLFSGD